MKITHIRTTPLALPFRQPYHWAGRCNYGAAVVLVEVDTDERISGLGESTAGFPAEGVVHALKGVSPLFVGEFPFDVERLLFQARFLGSYNHTPWYANLALAGLEMALGDIIGKAANRPVYQLLGGAFRRQVNYFGFLQGDTAGELAASAESKVAEGFSVIYMKVGRGEQTDLANGAAVRQVIGDRRLTTYEPLTWESYVIHLPSAHTAQRYAVL